MSDRGWINRLHDGKLYIVSYEFSRVIIYKNTLSGFFDDVSSRRILDKIESAMDVRHIGYDKISEERAWKDSTRCMKEVLETSNIPPNAGVFIEFNVPFTASRIDFGITGFDIDNRNSAVIVELKGWSEGVSLSENEGMVHAEFYHKDVLHPSYQAWSYANYLRYFNSEVVDGQVQVIPCAYLYNYHRSDASKTLDDPQYSYYTEKAQVFYYEDIKSFSDFIKRNIVKPDNLETLEKIENGKLTVSSSLQKSLKRVLHEKDFFAPMDNQVAVYHKLLNGIRNCHRTRTKRVYIVRGGPGTGKSVLALKLLAELIGGYEDKFTGNHIMIPTLYVTKTSAPREIYSKELKTLSKEVGVEYLFKGASSFVDAERNEYPAILVDEAHRLTTRSSQYVKGGKNQVMEIINAALASVFFIDEDQNVSMQDIGTIDEIEHWANEFGAEIVTNGLVLQTQFRCSGSGLYIAWLDDMLGIRKSENLNLLGKLPYDISVADSPKELMERIEKKRAEGYDSRILAGYCWDWRSHNTKDGKDFDLDGIEAQRWNTDYTWANNNNLRDEIGCVHTGQGMEFQYAGVIIGGDMVYRNGHIETCPEENHDKGALGGWRKDPARADRIIRNIYRTLMTRGMDGCIVYCVDAPLSEHIKRKISDIRY
ncbi:hypothetical protein TALC_00748 [Thermoplasmatales archaeon BRNA1]|nr:hypothetical protein TALC_00748 [Thermoplasmatales archaeon BRNA1]